MKVTQGVTLRALVWLGAVSYQGSLTQASLQRDVSINDVSHRKLVGTISGLELMNTLSDTKVADLQDGAVIVVRDIDGMSRPSFNILAVVDDEEAVQSMTFAYNNEPYHRIEYAPFSFCGHVGSDLARCPRLGYGTHTVTAVPYSKNDAQGDAGEPLTVTFSIVEDGDEFSVEAPTPTPGPADSTTLLPTQSLDADPATPFPTGFSSVDSSTLLPTESGGDPRPVATEPLDETETDAPLDETETDAPFDTLEPGPFDSPTPTPTVLNGLPDFPTSDPEPISDGPVGEIVGLQLFNSKTDKKIMDLTNSTIVDIVDMDGMTEPTFNIIASVRDGANIQSVKFGYGRLSSHRIENGTAPYAFCGRKGASNYKRCKRLEYGTHTVTATPYERSGGLGTAGTPYTVTFKVISGSVGDEDVSPPELISLIPSNTTSDVMAIDVTGGNAVLEMEVTIQDDKSGFKSGYIAVYEEKRLLFHASDSFELATPSLAGEPVIFNAKMTFQESTPSGTYELQLYLVDEAGNEVDIKSEDLEKRSLPAFVEVVSDAMVDDFLTDDFSSNFTLDVELLSFTAVSPTTINVTSDDQVVEFELVVESNATEGFSLSSGSVYAYYADPFEVDFSSFQSSFSMYDSTPGEPILVTMEIPEYIRPGTYALQIQFGDFGFSDVIDTPELEERGFVSTIEILNSRFDEQAPVLVDLQALSPTTVNVTSEEASVQMQIVVRDDVAGLKSGSVYIYRQSFGFEGDVIDLNFRNVGNTGGKVTVNFTVPFERYIEQGKYKIGITLMDDAKNYVEISPKELDALGFPSFIDVVNLIEDFSPPRLVEFELLSPTPINVTDGSATVAVKIVARDKGSGLEGGSLLAYNIRDFDILTESFRFPGTGNTTATVFVNLTLPRSSTPGKYNFQLQMSDVADNEAYIDNYQLEMMDFPSSFRVINTGYDNLPPRVINFTALSPLTVNVTSAPATVRFKLDVKEASTIEESSLILFDTSSFDFIDEVTFSQDNKTINANGVSTFFLNLTVPQYLEEQRYFLILSLSDAQFNTESLFPDELERRDFPSFVNVKNAIEDDTAPELVNMVTVGPVELNVTSGPATAKFKLTVQDDLSGLQSASIFFYASGEFDETFDSYQDSTPSTDGSPVTFELSVEFTQSTRAGTYRVERLILVDDASNELLLDASDLARLDFPSSVTIINSNKDFEPPVLVDVIALSPTSVDVSLESAEVTIQVTVQDSGSGFMVGQVSLFSNENFQNISTVSFSPPSPVADTPLTFNVTIPIPMFVLSDSYQTAFILWDAASNLAYPGFDDDDATVITIDVTNTNEEDRDSAQLLNFTVQSVARNPSTEVTTMKFQVVASDDLSGVRFGYVAIFEEGDIMGDPVDYHEFSTKDASSGKKTFTVTFTFEEDFEWNEDLRLDVYVFDFAGNELILEGDDLAALGFIAALPPIPED